MDKLSYLNNVNGAYLEDLYQTYLKDPGSLDPSWHRFFEGFELGSSQDRPTGTSSVTSKEVSVVKLITAYRNRGHLLSDTNPVRERRKHKADLELDYFELSEEDLDTEFDAGKEIKIGRASLRTILEHLKKTYCSTIGAEFRYCRDERLRRWLYDEMETIANRPQFGPEEKLRILEKINQAVTFENFLQAKYVGKKRFALDGLEAVIPSLDTAIREGAKLGVKELVMGMAHRGRLNILVNIFGKNYEDMLAEFEDLPLPPEIQEEGDVKYHMGHSSDVVTEDGHTVHLSLVPNPSHLEAVNAVVEGIVRAKAESLYQNEYKQIIPLLIHGDASLAGQGVIYELAQISRVDGYSTGGTVHIVLNNQLGFTTNYREARSSVYCTDIAKVTESPVFHVNADDPESVVHAVQMAIKIRQEFAIDVFVDIVGYRRYGHNEGDEPRFTQPLLYKTVDAHPNVLKIFSEKMVEENLLTRDAVKKMTDDFYELLQQKLEFIREKNSRPKLDYLKRLWSGFRKSTPEDFLESVPSGYPKENLDRIAKKLTELPVEFHPFNKMKKIFDARRDLFFKENKVDWAMGEQLAYGSLLLEGHPVRLSGQDSQRGTFSHRHAVIRDYENEKAYVPLQEIDAGQAPISIHNSILSEYCILGYEFGYSLASPKSLTIWEAQFGDFSNGAQIIIDQFLSASETKWQRMSGLVLLLPHGYEGQGPEHSSARPERYLQLCAEHNMYVANISTPANFFHAVRRQIKNPFRKPLVVFTPKSLLRHPRVVSPVEELVQGSFREVIDDEAADVKKTKRVIFCTGKIYYDLLARREKLGKSDTALVRVEQLYPLPRKKLEEIRKKYASAKEFVWLQEEPANMGAWSHMLRHLNDFELRLISRPEASSPATAFTSIHETWQEKIVSSAFS